MRLFCLEVKRIMKSRRTIILLTAALLLAVIMAYLPISFESINRPGDNGSVVELNGMEAIQFKREYRQDTYGDVTPQKIADALRIYQKYVQQYGTVEDMPLDVYTENVMAIRPLLDRLPEAFADPQTGIGADLMEIDPDMVEQNLYGQFASHLNDIMNLEQKEHPSAREFAIAKYAEVDKPYQLYSGLSRDAFDYIELYIFILSILCIAMVAPTFANEYQTGSDSIMR